MSDNPDVAWFRRAPLGSRYPAGAAMALLALCPFIVLTTAFTLFERQVTHDLHTTTFLVELSNALANAGYAFGAVMAADLIMRIPQRSLFLACEAVFAAGSLLAAEAGGISLFTVARVLQGVSTGILLVVALPPLVTKYGPDRFPLSAMIINLGLFGMVTLGPLSGGITGTEHAWRELFLAVGALAAAGMTLGAFAFDFSPAAAPGQGFDMTAIPLAFAATFLPFFGAAWLLRGGLTSAVFLVPFIGGIAILLTLVGLQFVKGRALMPVAPISHTLPIFGIGTAMIAGAAFVTLLELTISYLTSVVNDSPVVTGLLLAPMLLGVAVAAVMFKRFVVTRWLALLVIAGTAAVGIAAALLLALTSWTAPVLVPVSAALLGFGAGAAVAPGLFMGGMTVPSSQLGPTFALVELLRSEAAFILAPILAYVATTVFTPVVGIQLGVGITLGLLAVMSTALIGVLLAGGVGPHEPDLEAWLNADSPAYESAPVAAPLRAWSR